MADRSFLHWPFFADGHRVLAARAAEWAAREVGARGDDDDVDGACRELADKLGAAGFLQLCTADPDSNDARIDVIPLCIMRESLGYHEPLADFVFAMQGLGSGAISLFGSEAQRRKYLPGVRSGKLLGTFALSEPRSGSDVAAIETRAVKDGEHFVLNGEKTWISNGGIADFHVVFARTGEAPGARGLSAFIIDEGTPGLEIRERIPLIAPHPLARIGLADCRIPASALIGDAGAGFRIAMSVLDIFRPTVGAAALGFARRAFDEALARATGRELFGAPMAELQMVQAMLAEMALDIDAAALLVYRAAWAKDAGAKRVTREAAMAKLHASEAAQRVIDKAVQIHGGAGVTSGNVVERLYREIRSLRIYEGASEVQKVIIARQHLDAYRKERS